MNSKNRNTSENLIVSTSMLNLIERDDGEKKQTLENWTAEQNLQS